MAFAVFAFFVLAVFAIFAVFAFLRCHPQGLGHAIAIHRGGEGTCFKGAHQENRSHSGESLVRDPPQMTLSPGPLERMGLRSTGGLLLLLRSIGSFLFTFRAPRSCNFPFGPPFQTTKKGLTPKADAFVWQGFPFTSTQHRHGCVGFT